MFSNSQLISLQKALTQCDSAVVGQSVYSGPPGADLWVEHCFQIGLVHPEENPTDMALTLPGRDETRVREAVDVSCTSSRPKFPE